MLARIWRTWPTTSITRTTDSHALESWEPRLEFIVKCTCMVVGFRTFWSQILSCKILPGNRCWRHKHGTEKDVFKEVGRESMESTFEQFPSSGRALPRQRASTRILRRWCCSTRKTRRSRRCKPCWTRCSRSSTPDHRNISQRDKLVFKAENLDSGFLAPTYYGADPGDSRLILLLAFLAEF